MLVEVKVPVLAESVTDATVLDWHKQPGDPVTRGDNLVDLETDKVTLEVPAPDEGVLKEIRQQSGATVVTGDILATIDTEGEAGQEPDADASGSAQTAAGVPAAAPPATAPPAQPRPSPAARKLLQENGIEATDIPASGKDGRITKADVLAYMEQLASRPETAAPEPAAGPVPAAVPSGRQQQRVPMTRLRKRAAERLLAAVNESAMLTTFNEVNMQPVMDLRNRYKEAFEEKHGVRLGFMSFFTRAVVEALKQFPVINASVDGDDILYHDYYDIGIAVSSPRGLVVPVIRDADRLSFAAFEGRMAELGERARNGRLAIEDLTGGTFTITNGGVFGSLLSTPILNQPQSAILGMHKIQQRPVAEQGEVVIRPMMYVALSYDHRIIDGAEAVRFLVHVKQQLEDPARMLLDV